MGMCAKKYTPFEEVSLPSENKKVAGCTAELCRLNPLRIFLTAGGKVLEISINNSINAFQFYVLPLVSWVVDINTAGLSLKLFKAVGG